MREVWGSRLAILKSGPSVKFQIPSSRWYVWWWPYIESDSLKRDEDAWWQRHGFFHIVLFITLNTRQGNLFPFLWYDLICYLWALSALGRPSHFKFPLQPWWVRLRLERNWMDSSHVRRYWNFILHANCQAMPLCNVWSEKLDGKWKNDIDSKVVKIALYLECLHLSFTFFFYIFALYFSSIHQTRKVLLSI